MKRSNAPLPDTPPGHPDEAGLFRRLFEQAPIGYVMLEQSGIILQANQAFCRMVGRTSGETNGQSFFDFIDPQQRRIFKHVYRVLYYQPGDQDLELPLVRDGQVFRVRITPGLLSGAPTQAAGQAPSPLLLIITDLTGQTLAEEIQRVNDLRFRQMTETISEVFWLRERAGRRLLYVSPAYQQVFGRPAEELLEDPYSFLARVHPEDRARVQEAQRRLIEAGETFSLEYRILDAEGQVRWIWARSYPMLDVDGTIIRYAGLAADISRLKRTEESLRKSEQRYRSLFTTMQEGFALHEIITDDDGNPLDYRFLEINPAFERVTGLKASDLMGRTVRDRLPNIEEIWIERYGRVALTGIPDTFEEFSRDLGRWFQVQVYSPRSGQFATIIMDTTERRQAEAALRQSAEQNRLLLRELQHRVKNSLGLIIGMIGLEADRLSDPSAVAVLEELEERIRVVSELYKELHSAGATQQVTLSTYFERIVSSASAAYMASYRPGADGSPDAAVQATPDRPQIYLEAQLVEVRASVATSLGLILNELLTNALKYAFPQGGGEVRVRLRQVVTPQGSYARVKLVLEVEDNGVGLPEGFQAERPAGLGMQLVDMLTRSLQGRLVIQPRRPTRFLVEVPVRNQAGE